jgi:hypothetical protein
MQGNLSICQDRVDRGLHRGPSISHSWYSTLNLDRVKLRFVADRCDRMLFDARTLLDDGRNRGAVEVWMRNYAVTRMAWVVIEM